MDALRTYPRSHRAHDYRTLLARWRRVARATGLKLRLLAHADGYPVYYLRHAPAVRFGPGEQPRAPVEDALYLSAGIHGDEPAGTEALAAWAETALPALVRPPGRSDQPGRPFLLLPCLNPWGLVNNARFNAAGIDLNRVFDRDDLAPVAELKRLVARWRFTLGVALHEDYDAQGIYVYELCRQRAADFGETLLTLASQVLPLDGRARIEGRRAERGLVRRRDAFLRVNVHPEALYFYRRERTQFFTIETPSEFGLAERVQAHVALLDECVRRFHRRP